MLDQNFCEALEYKFSDIFRDSVGEDLSGYWCDGILLSEESKYYSQKFVNDNRQVNMQAFVGKNGQTLYSLVVKFGNKALSRYARGLTIVDCIPQTDFKNWFRIDIMLKEIEIQLD